MMIVTWRIVQAHLAQRAFSGEGARRYGGRWNSKGQAVIYTAESISLAVLEILVHIQIYDIMGEYVYIPVEFDHSLSLSLNPDKLPDNWYEDPAPLALKKIGDSWVESQESVVLEVPSAIVPAEKIFLINPAHPDFSKINIGEPVDLEFDPRLLKR